MTEHKFTGFPRYAESIPIPVPFFTLVLPYIKNISELKVVLTVFKLIKYKRGHLRFVTAAELMTDKILVSDINTHNEKDASNLIEKSMDLAVEHGSLIKAHVVLNGVEDNIYVINQEPDKTSLNKLLKGELSIPEMVCVQSKNADLPVLVNIYQLYEENIGVITPLIAEELKRAESIYPIDWINESFSEAVKQNIRSWKYIASILERWTKEGKTDGKIGRYSKKEKDTRRFVRGKYGHMVNR